MFTQAYTALCMLVVKGREKIGKIWLSSGVIRLVCALILVILHEKPIADLFAPVTHLSNLTPIFQANIYKYFLAS